MNTGGGQLLLVADKQMNSGVIFFFLSIFRAFDEWRRDDKDYFLSLQRRTAAPSGSWHHLRCRLVSEFF